MFNNLMKTIGTWTMFSNNTPMQQAEEHGLPPEQLKHNKNKPSAALVQTTNPQPDLLDVSVNLDDANESDSTHLPAQKFGRMCDCPKDP